VLVLVLVLVIVLGEIFSCATPLLATIATISIYAPHVLIVANGIKNN
jgi:hypothetical protein